MSEELSPTKKGPASRKPDSRLSIARGLSVLLVAAGGLLVAGCSGGGETTDSAAETPTGLDVSMDFSPGDFAQKFCPRPSGDGLYEVLGMPSAKTLKVRVSNGETDELIVNGFADQASEYSDPKDFLANVTAKDGKGCTVRVALPDVPRDLNYYTIQADLYDDNFNTFHGDNYSKDDLETSRWKVSVVIAN